MGMGTQNTFAKASSVRGCKFTMLHLDMQYVTRSICTYQ